MQNDYRKPASRLPQEIIARSLAFRSALAELYRYAKYDDVPLLLEGERGTGKTLLARLTHDISPRATRAFYPVSIAALEDALVGSALFGHVRGAFTDAREQRHGYFVSASGGSLFLDEIGKASLKVQNSLLAAIEENEIWPIGSDRPIRVDVRLIAATNVPLTTLVDRQGFLPDLLDRLGWFRIHLPTLRERADDIPDLVAAIIRERAPSCGYGRLPEVDDELMMALQCAPWPGNLRELTGVTHRLLVDADGAEVITLDDCRGDLSYLAAGADHRTGATVVADTIRQAGSVAGAARLLGVHRSTLYRRRAASPGHEDIPDSRSDDPQ